jgi:hypothetical protein
MHDVDSRYTKDSCQEYNRHVRSLAWLPRKVHMVHIFERPLASGWVYPCSPEDIRQRLQLIHEGELEWLWAIGLVPSTHKDHSANGRYFRDEKPLIHLYSYPATLVYKLPPFVKPKHILQRLAVELEYGMEADADSPRAPRR